MADEGKKVSAVKAGVVGVVVGTAIGATAVVMADEKNRKKVMEEGKKGWGRLKRAVKQVQGAKKLSKGR